MTHFTNHSTRLLRLIFLFAAMFAVQSAAQQLLLDRFAYADLNGDCIVDVADVNAAINNSQHTPDAKQAVIDHMLAPKGTLRVLFIGNSFSCDAVAYLPYIFQQVAPDIQLTVGIAYRGGATLQIHYEKGIVQEATYEHFFKWKDGGPWQSIYPQWSVQLKTMVTDEPWDLIVLQQGSVESCNANYYQPYINNIMDWLRNTKKYTGRFAYLIPPAYADGYYRLSDPSFDLPDTSEAMFAHIIASTRTVLRNVDFQFLLPCGTALQAARLTPLDFYGDWATSSANSEPRRDDEPPHGHMTCADGLHLQDGIGCYVEACAIAIALTGTPLPEKTFDGPSTQWNVPHSQMPQDPNSDFDMDSLSQSIARQCAMQAILRPYSIR